MLDTAFWKKYFKVYDVLNLVVPYQELIKEFINQLKLEAGQKVLDAGCGTGNLGVHISRLGCHVTGVDFSREALDQYRIKIKKNKTKLILSDLSKELPFRDNSFDRVVSNNVLYTIELGKRENLIKEMYRVLKPGGVIVLSNVKYGWSPFTIYKKHIQTEYRRIGFIKLILKIVGMAVPTLKMFYYNFKIQQENTFGNYNFFKPKEQAGLLEKAGFKNVSNDISTYAGQAVMNSAKK